MRATLRLSSPAWLAHPISTSPMAAASNCSFRLSNSSSTKAAKSSVRTGASVPPKFPMGVLTPSAMYASILFTLVWSKIAVCGQGPLQNHGILPYENRYRLGVPPYRGGIAQFNEAMAKAFTAEGTNALASILAGNTQACFSLEPINTRTASSPNSCVPRPLIPSTP